MKQMILSELERTKHTAMKKMEEINKMDIDEIDSDELHDMKNCLKILHCAVALEKELSGEAVSNRAEKMKDYTVSA